jgi:hypothetical protein
VVAGPQGGRATFLPAVWDQLPEPRDFVDRLWQKAGLDLGTWPDGLRTWRYRVDEHLQVVAEVTSTADEAVVGP